jgi:hypothetical protein
MGWITCCAVVCRMCGVARVDLGARSEEEAIEEAHRSGWEDGLCPTCAEWQLRRQLRRRLKEATGRSEADET